MAAKAGGSWADQEVDENETDFTVYTDDGKGKTTTSVIERGGKRIKVTKKSEVRNRTLVTNLRGEERKKSWVKFGKALENDEGTTVLQEPIKFSLKGTGVNQEKNKAVEGELTTLLNSIVGADGKFRASNRSTDDQEQEQDPKGAYRAPGGGGGGRGGYGGGGRRGEEYTLRVANLSESVEESSLERLFGRIGKVKRVFIVKNKQTGESKGFAFVSFHNEEDAKKALKLVDGFGFDHLILRCEWAQARQ